MSIEGPVNGSLAATEVTNFKLLMTLRLDVTCNEQLYHHSRAFTYWRWDDSLFEVEPSKAVPDGDWGLCHKQDVLLPAPSTTAKCLALKPSKMLEMKEKVSLSVRPADKGWKYCRDVVSTTDDRLETYGILYVFNELAGAVITYPGILYLRKLKVQFAVSRDISPTSDWSLFDRSLKKALILKGSSKSDENLPLPPGVAPSLLIGKDGKYDKRVCSTEMSLEEYKSLQASLKADGWEIVLATYPPCLYKQ